MAKAVEIVKTSSSKWIKTKGQDFTLFSWQAGYAAFSVSESHVEALTQYIAGQEQHHRHASFQDELRNLLARYHVAYDERYVWD